MGEDARVYSSHARKKTLDTEDVKLAVQLAAEQGFTSPPPREALLELARAKNATQLPLIQPKAGVRLPPDRHCLTATNYKLKTRQRPSGFDYGGGGGGGLKPQYNRGKPGGAKTTVQNPSCSCTEEEEGGRGLRCQLNLISWNQLCIL